MSPKGLRVEFSVQRPGRPQVETPAAKDSVPRVARLLALAHKWEDMVRRGEVKDYAEIAKLMGLSRARVTQICALALLAPTVQDALLLDETVPQSVPDRVLRPIIGKPEWHRQRAEWRAASGST